MKSKLGKKIVIITGASTGIGFDATKTLSKQGFFVMACARKDQDLDRLRDLSENVLAIRLDVNDPEAIRKVAIDNKEILDQASSVNLINNAGIAVAGPIEALDVSEFRRQFDVNFFAVISVTQAFLPWIRKTKGRILNISSVSGLSAAPFLGPYSASKFALEALSDSLRRELASFGVKVILIEPGPIDTPIWHKGLGDQNESKSKMNLEILKIYNDQLNRFQKYVAKVASFALPVQEVSKVLLQQLIKSEPDVRVLVTARHDAIQTRLSQILPAKWVDKAIAKRLKAKH